MALFEWKSEFSVSVTKFDDHHKKLINLINELHEAMLKGKQHSVIGKILNALADYTKYHFAEEEKLMVAYKYPGLVEHRAQHDAFVEKVADCIKKYEEGKLAISLEVMNFLRDWLKGHILSTDKKYTAFFAANKVA
ncbi:Bacteriohemerythrin [Methylophilaceae bacterium]|nr:Bacteriohemerythrin [Methylophilaceae bacterium]